MAITNGTANVQIIKDTSDTLIVKCLYYTTTPTNEADVLKVNAHTLAYASYGLTTQSRNIPIQPGMTVVGNTSAASAKVVDWNYATNTVQITQLTGNTAFDDDEVLDFKIESATIFSVNSAAASAFTTPTRVIQLVSVWHSISSGMSVEIGYGGTPIVPSLLLAGNGYFGKNALGARLPNAAATPTGHVHISTYSTGAGTYSYNILMEFSKNAGFASPALG